MVASRVGGKRPHPAKAPVATTASWDLENTMGRPTHDFAEGVRCSMKSEHNVQPSSLFTLLAVVEAELRAMKDMLAELKVNQDDCVATATNGDGGPSVCLRICSVGRGGDGGTGLLQLSTSSQRAFAGCSPTCRTSCPRSKRTGMSCAKAATNGAAGPSVF
jgi:hypothetical protein